MTSTALRPQTDAARRRARGFTMMELIVVIVISGVLAVVVMPKFDVATSAGGRAYADSVKAGLRYSRSVAVGHRRLVCVDFDANSQMLITIASANPATSCNSGIDGQSVFATPPAGITAAWSAGGMVYFQPSGRLTSDGAGNTGISKQVNITGETAISVEWFGRVE
ncbi:MAG: prepilin-type N-terminal cleavage/methylation domain-containing protein [Ideonella sp.]|nr:prepilin-type N-terminal cleavage/methylation domain-containing protein [Ideonella sp.]